MHWMLKWLCSKWKTETAERRQLHFEHFLYNIEHIKHCESAYLPHKFPAGIYLLKVNNRNT